ncbi:hypothetical protein ACX1N5_00800 [Acinetobacter sp. ANC 4636]
MNNNIIPYVPIAPRIKASNPKSELLCRALFEIVDKAVQAQFTFNHDTSKGKLSICPDQVNDLIQELAKNKNLEGSKIDIEVLKPALSDLIYPVFKGEFAINSPIWNNSEVRVWQFQLNQIVRENHMKNYENLDLILDQALASVRIWRNSLETGSENRDVVYKRNDLIYKLMDLEQKLQIVQNGLDE